MGDEEVDSDSTSTIKDYIKSRLFFVPNIRILQLVIYLIVLILLFQFTKEIYSEFEILVFWSIISVIVQIPLTIYLYYIMKRDIKFKLDSRILMYLIIGIAVFALTSYLMEEYLVLNENIFEFLPQVLIYLSFSIDWNFFIFSFCFSTSSIDLYRCC